MRKVHVQLIHPGNPFAAEADGIVSVQRNFVAAAPRDWVFDYWGVGRATVHPPAESRPRFHAVVATGEQRPIVPVSLSFGVGLARQRTAFRTGILRFDRVESALPLVRLRQRLPRVIFLHTWNVRDNRDPSSESRWRRLAPAYDILFQRTVRSMDLIYVLRPDMAEALEASMPGIAHRIRPFSVPVDTDLFHPLDRLEREEVRAQLRRSHGIGREARLIVFAGRVEGQKRPLSIPPTVAQLRADGVDAHAMIVGSGSLDAQLRRSIERHAPGHVHVIGPLSQVALQPLLAAADVLLLPSAFEGLPNVVLESLACGTPVVASRGPGRVAEVVSDDRFGALVGQDPGSIAAGLRRVFDGGSVDRARCRRRAEGFSPSALNAPIYEEFSQLQPRDRCASR